MPCAPKALIFSSALFFMAEPPRLSPALAADPGYGALKRTAGQVPACVGAFVCVPAYCCPCLPEQVPGTCMLGSVNLTKHSTLTALLVIYSRLPPAALRCFYCNKHQKDEELARSGNMALAVHAMAGRRV